MQDGMREFGAPVLAVCGFSGSGKTTLLEAVIPRLVERGLAVAIVKHDAHGFEVDKPGKDSDRFFRAGATVALSGPDQQFERRGRHATVSLPSMLARLGCEHDIVFVEGHKDVALPKLWMANAENSEAPPEVTNILRTLPWNSDRILAFMDFVDRWLPEAWSQRRIQGGLLIGGMSSRMGSAKHLKIFGGRTLGAIVMEALITGSGNACCQALGAGELSGSLQGLPQLPDPPSVSGPAAALISAHRWDPAAAWVVSACDHPWLRDKHVAWLLSHRRPGRWAVIPQQRDGHPCPTVALYEPQGLEILARMSSEEPGSSLRPAVLLNSPHTYSPEIPVELEDGWKNVNSPDELRTEEERLTSQEKKIGD